MSFAVHPIRRPTRWLQALLLVAINLSLLVTGQDARAQQAAKSPSLTFIVDGSGSMWGNLKGARKTKIETVQQLLKTAMGDVKPAVRLGLASFGHRRKADCSDVEVLAVPLAGDQGRVQRPLAKLDPRGKGPLTQTLIAVAGALDETALWADHIVLIHDDPDNCRDDICPVTAQIKASHPLVVIHTISLGLRDEDVQAMACVAKSTGGRAFDVRSVDDLPGALAQVIGLANSGVGPAEPGAVPQAGAKTQPVIASLAPKPVVPKKPNGPSGLSLSARLSGQGEVVSTPIAWQVFAAPLSSISPTTEPTIEVGQPLAQALSDRWTIALPAGSYIVEVKAGLVSERRAVQVEPQGPTSVEFVLSAGRLVARALDRVGGSVEGATALTLTPTLLQSEANAAGCRGCPLWLGAGQADLILAPGAYTLALERDRIRRQVEVTIAAGQSQTLDVPLGTGRLVLRALDRDGGNAVRDPLFTVTEEDPEAPQGRRTVGRSAALEPEFILPAGTYVVAVETGAATTRERVSIEAGGTVNKAMVMNLGRLVVSTRLAGGGAGVGQLDEQVGYRIFMVDRETRQVFASTQALNATQGTELELGAGRYRIESMIGRQNAREMRDFEIKPGQRTPLVIEVPAGRLSLKAGAFASQVGAVGSGDLIWDIADSKGQSVWRTLKPDPVVTLKAGRYVVAVEAKGQRRTMPIEVKVGDNRSLEVGRE